MTERTVMEPFVPVAIEGGDGIAVRWRTASAIAFQAPFFDQDVEAGDSTNDITTDLATLLEIGRATPSGPPAGIIAHVSRCGSTLVANALRRLDLGPVLSEPQPVYAALGAVAPASPPLAQDCLRALANLWTARLAQGARPVLKLPSWGLNHVALIAGAWPQTPWALCLREPDAVLNSIRRQAPEWARIVERPPLRPKLGFPVDVLAEGAWSWERAVERLFRAAAKLQPPPAAVLDYRNLAPETIVRLAQVFYPEQTLPDDAHARVARAFALDAKSARPTPFVRREDASHGVRLVAAENDYADARAGSDKAVAHVRS